MGEQESPIEVTDVESLQKEAEQQSINVENMEPEPGSPSPSPTASSHKTGGQEDLFSPQARPETIAPGSPASPGSVPITDTPNASKADESRKSSTLHHTSNALGSTCTSGKLAEGLSSNEKLRVDRSYIPLEELEYIKKIFEAFDFVKTGKSAQMDIEVRRMRAPPEPKNKKDALNRKRRHSVQITDEVEGDNLLPSLNADDDESNAKRRRLLLFGLIHTRPGIDSEHREDGQDECLLNIEDEKEVGSSDEEDEEEDWLSEAYDKETAIALRHLAENQRVVDVEIEKMEAWKVHQRMLRAEAKANQEVNALANIVAPAVPLPLSVIPSSAGIPFQFFAQQVVARYFHFFFPINSGFKDFQPRRRQHMKAVLELFRLMDTNADDLVSWDEFSSHILQAGQRYILEAELRHAAAKAASSSRAGSIAPNEQGATDDENEQALPTANVEYELTFTPEPTNSSSWQATYPLVHHLYHEEPITKLIVSDRSRRYITGGPDGLVKLWKPDPRLLDSQHRMAIVHERNLVCTRAAITDMALSSLAMGDAEVVAASAMDGTITLMRTATGEVVRTLLGVRGAEESGVAVLNDIAARGADREKKEFEEDDLLSLRNRQPVVAGTVVRMPYTIPAYHDDMMEIFFGKTNRYFQGLDVVAPTYTHLKRPVASSSDVLFEFGAEKLLRRLSQRGEAPETTRKCWFATALAVGRCNPLASNASLKDGAYLVLGFEAGVVQVYELSMNWFCVTQLSATRVEPPSARKPIHSFMVHDATISGIIVSDTADIMITSSDDGTLQVRQFSRLNHPHIVLGEGIPNNTLVPPMLRQLRNKRSTSISAASSRRQSTDSTASAHSAKGSDPAGHVKRITCMCWNEELHIIVSGGMDHLIVFWTSRSHRLIRQLDLRDMQNSVHGLSDLGSCGYPIDVSFMKRGTDPLRLLVLDSKRVIRLINAVTGSFMGVLIDHSPSSVSLGDMLVARYERFDDRLLLGGRCVRAWDIPRDEEYAKDYFGHRKPVVFMGMDPTLKIIVTADEDNIVMWNFSIIPYELALQRREDRRLNRERARAKARKDAEKRRALRMARKARAALLAAEEAEKKAKEVIATAPRAQTILDMEDDEEEEADKKKQSILSHEEDSEEEEIAQINATAYMDEIPFIHHLDGNQFNLTYWRAGSRVIRTWKVDSGVRSVTMETSTRAGGIYVALLREKAIVQYNSFNGAALRKFVFPETASDIYSLFAGEAVLNQTENALAPLLCAAFEEDAQNGLASIYHLNHGGGDPDSAFKRELQEEAELEARGIKVKRVKEAGVIGSHRNLLVKGAACTSVAILPSLGVVVIGGRGVLSYSPIMESTSHGIPCTNLQEEPPKERKREREAAIRAANLSLFGGSGSQAGSVGAPVEDWKAPVNLMALLPGRLVVDPTSDARSKAKAHTASPEASNEAGNNSVAPSKGANDDSDADVSEVKDATGKETPLGTGNFYEDGQKDALGFIGHIVPVRDLGYVFTATNDGTLQLWNIRSSSEVLRCRATLRIETITSLSVSCYGPRKANHSCETMTLNPAISSDRSNSESLSKTRRNLLRDSYYVAVGDQSGYVLLLDFNELPWEDDVPLDVIPGIETKVIVLDRWRAHRQDVRGVCFVGNPEVRGSETVGHEFLGGLRRSFQAGCREGDDAPVLMSLKENKTPGVSQPMTIVTTGEDTYTYVWTWESGTVNCLGCFGGGVLSPITPPITQLPKKTMTIFESARRQYVLQRLVVGFKFFQSHNVQSELDMVVREMEREAIRLSEEDTAWNLSFWGSLAMLSGDKLPYRETIWSEPRNPPAAGLRSTVFDYAGFKGMKNRMYHCPESCPRPSTSPETARGRAGRLDTMVLDTTTEVYAPYVFAFMRGTYEDNSVRDCLLRIVKELRPRIKKLAKRVRRRASGTFLSGSTTSLKHRFSDQVSVGSVEHTTPEFLAQPESMEFEPSAASPSPNLMEMKEVRGRGSATSITDEGSVPTDQPSTSLPPMGPPKIGMVDLDEIQQAESVGEGSEEGPELAMRGALGIPMYKVQYKQPALAKEVHYTAFKDEDAAEEKRKPGDDRASGAIDPERLAEKLPHIVMEDFRLAAAQGNPIHVLATRRISFSDGKSRGSAAGGMSENLEEAALKGECATTIVERAYIGRRREDAIRQILKEQIDADIPASEAKEKQQEIQLSIDAGLIAIDSYQDFASTKTSNVLFDKERVIVEPTVQTHTKIPESFLKTVMPTSFNIKQMGEMREVPPPLDENGLPKEDDWYEERDKIKRQRRYQDSLWAPSRIVQTLMNWESPIPPHLREQKNPSQAPSVVSTARSHSNRPLLRPPSSVFKSDIGEDNLQLPNFLPSYLCQSVKAAGKQGELSSYSRAASEGISHSNPKNSSSAIKSPRGPVGGVGGNVWDTALDYNKDKLNLNALVASEVNVLKGIAKQSLEERENFLKQQQRQMQEENGEDEEAEKMDSPEASAGPISRAADVPSSWLEQPRPPTLKLSEVRKRMTKPAVTIL